MVVKAGFGDAPPAVRADDARGRVVAGVDCNKLRQHVTVQYVDSGL